MSDTPCMICGNPATMSMCDKYVSGFNKLPDGNVQAIHSPGPVLHLCHEDFNVVKAYLKEWVGDDLDTIIERVTTKAIDKYLSAITLPPTRIEM